MSGDLISRQSALDALKGFDVEIIPYEHGKMYVQETLNAIHHRLSDLPSAEPERRWIPVTEALPEEEMDVLLQFSKNLAVGYQEDGDWMIATGSDWYSGLDEEEEKPIAWMPLPEPLRGDR